MRRGEDVQACLECRIFVPEWSFHRLAVIFRSSRFRLKSDHFWDEGETICAILPGRPMAAGGPMPTAAHQRLPDLVSSSSYSQDENILLFGFPRTALQWCVLNLVSMSSRFLDENRELWCGTTLHLYNLCVTFFFRFVTCSRQAAMSVMCSNSKGNIWKRKESQGLNLSAFLLFKVKSSKTKISSHGTMEHYSNSNVFIGFIRNSLSLTLRQ